MRSTCARLLTVWFIFIPVQCDPESASSLITNPVIAAKTILIPLDVTHLVPATPEVLHRLLHQSPTTTPTPSSSSKPSPLRTLLHDILSFFTATYSSIFGLTDGPPLHDPLAVAVILDALGIEDFGFDDYPEADERTGRSESGEPGVPGQAVRWIVKVVTDGEHIPVNLKEDTEEGWENQVGRTVMVREEGNGRREEKGVGIRIPRRIRDVERFWDVLLECVGRAEEATRGKRVWVGW